MKLQTLVALILCNLVWSANPAMAKVLMTAGASPTLTAWLRYSSALLGYVLASAVLRMRGRTFFIPKKTEWFWAFLIGVMVFYFAPMTQMTGLYASHATENALIVAMEPLITVFLAWLILREAISWFHAAAFVIALGGFALLGAHSGSGSASEHAHLIGNILMLISLAGEACYSIAGRKLLALHAPRGIFGTALMIGVVFLTFTLLAGAPGTLSGLHGFGTQQWLAVLFLGPLGTSLTYIYWMAALQEASVASVALTLFVQPVFGSIWGAFFLNERLSFVQWVGAAFILVAVLLAMRAPPSRPI
jgi:drug/metabolite transporter (DMT)-like permease